jgi:Hypothetical chloroplast protein Ycf34
LTATQLRCICIDCKYVTDCSAYHFVESRHNQPHMTEAPTFTPRDGSPTIHVNVRTLDRNPQNENEGDMNNGGDGGNPLESFSPMITAPAVTYEYDVVACQDFVEDHNCWVRNMPEAIRIVNPDFVPS